MAPIERAAQAVWSGDLRGGNGEFTTRSRVIERKEYSYATRFENQPGTNPEELIAAAHASCFSMALAGALAKQGHKPERIITTATVEMEQKEGGGYRISRVRLDTRGWVPGIDEATFQKFANEAGNTCPVSTVLKPGLDAIEVEASIGADDAGLGGAFGF